MVVMRSPVDACPAVDHTLAAMPESAAIFVNEILLDHRMGQMIAPFITPVPQAQAVATVVMHDVSAHQVVITGKVGPIAFAEAGHTVVVDFVVCDLNMR